MDTSLAAQQVRETLRSAGFREWARGRLGWVVEADPQGGWVAVADTRSGVKASVQLQKYRDLLSAAGFTVKDDPLVPLVLRVTIREDNAGP